MESKEHAEESKSLENPTRLCRFCNKTFSSKQTLREHLYIHSGEKPYKCNEPGCQESFRQGSLLSIHKRVHREIQRGINQMKNPIRPPGFLKLTDLIGKAQKPNALDKESEEQDLNLARSLDLAFIKKFL